MKIDVFNLKGEKKEQIELKDDVFGFKPNQKVLEQYVRVYQLNQRQGTSSTKNRSEVSGGGAKPWRQKGTGRARQGSIRSPIWVGGAVAHGPRPKDWKAGLNEKMKRIALKSILSLRMSDGKIFVIDNEKVEKPKTKLFSDILKKFEIEGKISLVWAGDCENLLKSARNIPGVFLVNESSFGAYDAVKSQNLVFLKDAVLKVQERISK
ncbi:MAG TPA: 50S ribosomal protein L4 [bacterium]|jgi:large subunit ribosomal protein L4|nr:50S ribosomal protein L4 [bacterium]